MTIQYVGYRGAAELCGVVPATMRSYWRFGMLPKPDAWVDDLPAWRPATIEKWNAARPGPGNRGKKK